MFRTERESWLAALGIFMFFSLLLGAARFYSIVLLSFEFELCIFYIPTVMLAIITAKIWGKDCDSSF